MKLRKILSIIIIALLLSTLCLTLSPQNVSSKTHGIKVLDYTYYIDAVGVLDIVGEVQNIGTSTIEKATITAVVYCTDGTIQGTVTGHAWFTYMAPQQRSPFLLEIGIPADYDDWYAVEISKVEITVKEANESNNYLYSDFKLTVKSAGYSTNVNEYGAYWIEGTVQNTGTQTASKLVVAAVYYNADGNLVAVGHTNYLEPHDVKPSETVTFKVGAYDTTRYGGNRNSVITSYSLLVDLVSPLMTGKAPTATAPTTGYSIATQNPQNQTASSRNHIYIITIAAIAFAIIAALLISRKNTPSSPKGKTNKQKKPTNKDHKANVHRSI